MWDDQGLRQKGLVVVSSTPVTMSACSNFEVKWTVDPKNKNKFWLDFEFSHVYLLIIFCSKFLS